MKKTFKFTEKERFLIFHLIENEQDEGTFTLIDRIEQIISERITPEPGSKSRERIVLERLLDKIKEAQSQGANYAIENEDVVAIALVLSINSPSAPITTEPGESGQSAEDVLDQHYKGYLKRIAFPEQVLAAMTTYASQVCADKDAKIKFWIDGWNHLSRMYDQSQSELDRLNESLTVMLRKNAELEAQIDQFTNPLRIG